MTTAARTSGLTATVRDVVALTKPRITFMVLVTAAAGMFLAQREAGVTAMPWTRIITVLVTTAAVVASANALNCWLERDSDRLMTRTMSRPLPDGRLAPQVALVLGLALGLVSVPALSFSVNALTGLLGAIALVSYVAVYTPMKPISSTALLVGAIPGALPPLMGWTAVTGRLDRTGILLFLVLFLWQIPHFIAIAIFRQEEYERAGLAVLPSVRGIQFAKIQAVVYAALLAPVSLSLFVLGVAGVRYFVVALVLNAVFVGFTLAGLRPTAGKRWARATFLVSLVYLTVLLPLLVIDARG